VPDAADDLIEIAANLLKSSNDLRLIRHLRVHTKGKTCGEDDLNHLVESPHVRGPVQLLSALLWRFV